MVTAGPIGPVAQLRTIYRESVRRQSHTVPGVDIAPRAALPYESPSRWIGQVMQ